MKSDCKEQIRISSILSVQYNTKDARKAADSKLKEKKEKRKDDERR